MYAYILGLDFLNSCPMFVALLKQEVQSPTDQSLSIPADKCTALAKLHCRVG